MKTLSETKLFDGALKRFQHQSESLSCEMNFSVYLPPQSESKNVPVFWWLSGLTCTDENFMVKAGAQRIAAELGMAIITPDTSPRGEEVPDDEDSWDFGVGAGFYLNATEDPWGKNYNMYDYVVDELPELVYGSLPLDRDRASISGHSMGGHGALVIGLRNDKNFRSISAFSPICAPTKCGWGKKALSSYLGSDELAWQEYDASELIRSLGSDKELLVDIGDEDPFLAEQLLAVELENACGEKGVSLNLRMQPGYDHSYYFVSSFIEEHLHFHSDALK